MKGMGAADGKIATALGAILPQAMAISGVLLMLAFLVLRLRRQPETTVPAAVAFFAGSVVGSIGVWFTPFW
jgi:hypothetical protein